MKRKEDIFTKKNNEKNDNNKKHLNKKNVAIGIIILLSVIVLAIATITLINKKGNQDIKDPIKENDKTKEEVKPKEEEKLPNIKIVDTKSKQRPYAVVVNNTPIAVKVQEGLNKAFIVYEIPTEGNTSRLMALFKTTEDITIGTIRSVRHNFLDFAKESDAILVGYGYSHYARDELLNKKSMDYVNGILGKHRSPFWRSNPEKLSTEHTVYTSTKKLTDFITKNKYRLESNKSSRTIQLNYSEEEINLNEMDKVKDANSVKLPYGNITTVFKYNKDTKEYTKYVNDKKIKDHKTGESITTKNIIVVKVKYRMAADKYYWHLYDKGTGDGYYITNGKAVPIKWYKEYTNSKTKYTYLNGEEVKVNDGRTYIEIHTTKKKLTIK